MADTSPPVVQVFIINYNRSVHMGETIGSLLAQTYPNKQIIFSDNGSTDNSLMRAKEWAPKGLEIRDRHPGTGHCYTHYNLCLKEATAPYVAIFHAEDLYHPSIVSRQIAFLETHPEIDVILTGAQAIASDGKPLWPIMAPNSLSLPILDPKEVIEFTLRSGNSFLVCPTALFRTSCFQRLDYFNGDEPICGDLDFWMRVLLHGKMAYINEPLVSYRMDDSQGSAVLSRSRTEISHFFRLMDRVLSTPHPVIADLGEEVKSAYEALRQLDLFQAGLNRIAKGMGATLFEESVSFFARKENKRFLRNFGTIDKLKLRGGRYLKLLPRFFHRTAAKILIKYTDPTAFAPLGWLLATNRRLNKFCRR